MEVSVKTGTLSGMVVSMLPNLSSEDFLRTAVLAVTGAFISFLATLMLKWLTRKKKPK